jgi:hypothetical protein
MEWQAIETAPRDGTPFLAAMGWGGEWDMYVARFCRDGSDFILVLDWDADQALKATHWVPLPEPPK